MAIQIKLTNKEKEQLLEKIKAEIEKINYSEKEKRIILKQKELNKKAKIIYKNKAWKKLNALLDNFDKEIAWNGTVHKSKEGIYVIEDIYVYPQRTDEVSIEVDEEEYVDWFLSLKKETMEKIRMQGHSHVNMKTTPSNTDMQQIDETISQLKDDMFYIFQIWNKRKESYSVIYDIKDNIFYENKDISCEHQKEKNKEINNFIKNTKEKIKNKNININNKEHLDEIYDYLDEINIKEIDNEEWRQYVKKRNYDTLYDKN